MKKSEDYLDIGAYLYYLFKPDGITPDASAFMTNDKFGMRAFVPTQGLNELCELDSDKITSFLEELINSGAYDYILIDMGESLNKEAKYILNLCDKVIVVSGHESGGCARTNRYLRCIKHIIGENIEPADESVDSKNDDVTNNLIVVYNNITEPEELAFDDTNIYIEYDPESIDKSGDVFEVSIDRDLGIGIKELVKKLT
jgi:cellulose biosynthesis protein BcsQ